MARPILLPLGFLLAAAAGCTSHSHGPIDFQVTGGLTGNGDGTPSLRIEADGTATRPAPSGGGTQTARLDLATLDDLEARIDAAEFATLAPSYTACNDCYIYVVSVQLDGATYTVQADTMAELPDPLDAVIAALKDITQRPLDWQ
jgi:hypothetical protein